MSSDHDHGHAAHSHGVSENTDSKRLSVALTLIVGFIGNAEARSKSG